MVKKIGTSGNDSIAGTGDADELWGRGGNDSISGSGGNDYMHGEGGGDTLLGGSGNDRIWGGSGIDALFGQDGADQIYGEFGDDYMDGGNGNDWLIGGAGNDRLRGGEGNDYLDGGVGVDDIQGGAGNDTLIHYGNNTTVATGAERFDGGSGLDKFVLSTDASSWNWSYIDVTGSGPSGVNAQVGLQSDIENEDYWEREQAGTVTNVEVFEASRNQKLYFEGGGSGQPDITVKCSDVGNFINLGLSNETIQCGSANDTIVFGGGTDRVTEFDPAEDFIFTFLARDGDDSRVDVREVSGQTVIAGYIYDDGVEHALGTTTIDAVGVNIVYEWQPV